MPFRTSLTNKHFYSSARTLNEFLLMPTSFCPLKRSFVNMSYRNPLTCVRVCVRNASSQVRFNLQIVAADQQSKLFNMSMCHSETRAELANDCTTLMPRTAGFSH
jgi:hypothetical protein